MRKATPLLVFLTLAVTACVSLSTAVITITQVVDSGMKDWAAMSVAGKSTPAIDVKVIAAHDNYRQACAVAQKALVAFKETGNNSDYVKALAAARASADGLIDLITPLITPDKSTELKIKLSKATQL